ncbi:STAS domain-containing protein [Sporosarcina sp. Sa2YVA2]|uniref:STAS domain-containing protein n=1 Tax=Sporosarcina quadrami TaxID=2762234 RepID=A0ABR8UDN5_9BACL|nr:STAS domain-containing protein [Sporosarcina quadrami]MBD7986148.1 STAS domain-containing protein [Sporosarcina quadrami]
MDHLNEIENLKVRIKELELEIKKMSVPIISSIVDDTILVPIVGYTGSERFEMIRSQVLEYIGSHSNVSSVIFDFTGSDLNGNNAHNFDTIAFELKVMNETLKLMDVRPISVGFHPMIVREIVAAGVEVELESYINFRMALKVLLKENVGIS